MCDLTSGSESSTGSQYHGQGLVGAGVQELKFTEHKKGWLYVTRDTKKPNSFHGVRAGQRQDGPGRGPRPLPRRPVAQHQPSAAQAGYVRAGADRASRLPGWRASSPRAPHCRPRSSRPSSCTASSSRRSTEEPAGRTTVGDCAGRRPSSFIRSRPAAGADPGVARRPRRGPARPPNRRGVLNVSSGSDRLALGCGLLPVHPAEAGDQRRCHRRGEVGEADRKHGR
jgi:hypothetical protein